jgi:hypothetical protein
VEFAAVALVFFTLLIGIMEFGRWLFTLNSVVESTRWGVRTAVVCDMNASAIKRKMKLISPGLTADMIAINYKGLNKDGTCEVGGPVPCQQFVEVGVGIEAGAQSDYELNLLFPFGVKVPIPSFATMLPAESLESVNSDGESNPVCDEI